MSDKLSELREKIDKVDEAILARLKDRIDLMREIGEIKRKNGLTLRDYIREEEKLEVIKNKAKELKVPEQFILRLWTLLFQESEEIEK